MLLLAFASGFGVANAQRSKLSPAARHMLAERASSLTRTAADTKVSAYVTLTADGDVEALTALGVEVNVRRGNILTARIPVDALAEVAALPCVTYVQTGTPVSHMMDVARSEGRVDLVQAGTGLSQPYTGNGVVVGIIDSGFEYTHPNFYDSENDELRIKRVWEQGYEDDGTPPAGFTYGREWATPEEIKTVAGDVMSSTHGTHVAGIAAGCDTSLGDYHGVAPDADIVLVSISNADTENNVNISDAISYIYGYADSVGKPCVINMSLGTQVGPHDGTSTFDVLADAMQGPGRLLVGSMGNFGGGNFHAAKTFDGTAADTLRTFVDFLYGVKTTTAGGTIDIWAEPGMEITVNVFTYRTYLDAKVDSFLITLPADEAPSVSETLSGTIGAISAYGEISPLNDKPHVMITSGVTSLRSGYKVGFEIVSSSAGTVNVWGDGNYLGLTDNDLEGWTEGDDLASPAEIGGTGTNIITVGAYVTRNEYTTTSSTSITTLSETVGDIASFSGVGPTADGRMKPDITAPGCIIASSMSSYYSSLTSMPLVGYYEWEEGSYCYYGYMQGTSMAAPYVTGVLATWLEANPQLTPDEARQTLMATAVTDEYTGDVASTGSNVWGYGKVDAWEGIKEVLSVAAGIDGVADGGQPAICLTPIGGGKVRIAGETAGAVAVTVVRIDGVAAMSCSLAPDAVAAGAVVDLSSCGSGIYVVRASAASGDSTVKVAVR